MSRQKIISNFNKAIKADQDHEKVVTDLINGKPISKEEENNKMLANMQQDYYSGSYLKKMTTFRMMNLPSSETMDVNKVKEENKKSIDYRNDILNAANEVVDFYRCNNLSTKEDIETLEAAKIELAVCVSAY